MAAIEPHVRAITRANRAFLGRSARFPRFANLAGVARKG